MRIRRPHIPLFLLLLLCSTVFAQTSGTSLSLSNAVQVPTIKTAELDSKLLARKVAYSVILPARYEEEKDVRFPVIYMLHGLGGDHKITKAGSVGYTERHRVIMVFVAGGTGFYTDSASNPNDKYESYVINELIPEIDKNFRTVADRRARAIAGVSMGGYGSLKFGIKHPQLFALAVSWSGAVNAATFSEVRSLPPIPGIRELLTSIYGDGKDRSTIDANDLFKLFSIYPEEKIADLPYFYLDCGTEDELGLFKPNRDLSGIMIDRKIPHEFRQFPGGHQVSPPNMFRDMYELSERIFAKKKSVQTESVSYDIR